MRQHINVSCKPRKLFTYTIAGMLMQGLRRDTPNAKGAGPRVVALLQHITTPRNVFSVLCTVLFNMDGETYAVNSESRIR